MVAVLAGAGSVLAGVLLHFLVVRLAAARPLPLLAATILIAGLAGLFWGSLPAAVYALLLAGAGMTSYLLLYIGVEHDSPTLALAGFIERHGSAGMPEGEVEAFIASHPFTATRIGKLLEQRIVVLDADDRYRMQGHVGLFVQLTHLYRRLSGMDKASG